MNYLLLSIFFMTNIFATDLAFDVAVTPENSAKVDELIEFATQVYAKDCDIQLKHQKHDLITNFQPEINFDESGENLRKLSKWVSIFLDKNADKYQRKDTIKPLVIFMDKKETDIDNSIIGLSHPVFALRNEAMGWLTEVETTYLENVIFINTKYLRQKNRTVLAHELGHLLGEQHVTEVKNIMFFESSKRSTNFTQTQCVRMKQFIFNNSIIYPY